MLIFPIWMFLMLMMNHFMITMEEKPIELSNCNLTGTFPTALLTLPQLSSLNLSDNQLTGDISEDLSSSMFNIQSLNISNNQFSGNIGAFAALLPNLTALYAEGNQFAEVVPMIKPDVTTLKLEGQNLNNVLDVDLSNVAITELTAQMPTILLYNHKQQTYGNSLTFTASDDNGWQSTISVSPTGISLTKKSEDNTYYGKSGDVLHISADDGDAKGTTLSMNLSFGLGDANFNGNTDVVDLQAQINYAFENYNDKLFNFTAANLWIDDVINVQDVVKMTDLLLAIDDVAGSRAMHNEQKIHENKDYAASIYIRDGQLWIDSDIPVAAFELTLNNTQFTVRNSQMDEMGFTCRSNSKGDIIRMVGYSMNGATLPVGLSAICEVTGGHTEIVNAVLSDIDAEEIPVRLLSGETIDIKEIENGKMKIEDSIYDLQGRRINSQFSNFKFQFRKGLYIQNGKKVVK